MRSLVKVSLFVVSVVGISAAFAQDGEFIFTPLIVDQNPTPSVSVQDSAPVVEEISFGNLIVGKAPSKKPVESTSKTVAAPQETLAESKPQPVAEPVKRLRDPFWPLGYIPKEWKSSPTDNTADTADWGAASKKIRLNYTRVVNGKTVAAINGVPKSAGDIIEVVLDGYRFQWTLLDISPNGQLKLQKRAVKKIN